MPLKTFIFLCKSKSSTLTCIVQLLVMKWIQLLQNVWASFISNYSCWMKVETKTSFIHIFNYQRISGMQAYLEEYHRSTTFHCKVTRVCLCYTQNISTCEKHLITHLRMECPEMIYSTVGEQKALNMFLLNWTINKQVDKIDNIISYTDQKERVILVTFRTLNIHVLCFKITHYLHSINLLFFWLAFFQIHVPVTIPEQSLLPCLPSNPFLFLLFHLKYLMVTVNIVAGLSLRFQVAGYLL